MARSQRHQNKVFCFTFVSDSVLIKFSMGKLSISQSDHVKNKWHDSLHFVDRLDPEVCQVHLCLGGNPWVDLDPGLSGEVIRTRATICIPTGGIISTLAKLPLAISIF